jgi:hypothetical protein
MMLKDLQIYCKKVEDWLDMNGLGRSMENVLRLLIKSALVEGQTELQYEQSFSTIRSLFGTLPNIRINGDLFETIEPEICDDEISTIISDWDDNGRFIDNYECGICKKVDKSLISNKEFESLISEIEADCYVIYKKEIRANGYSFFKDNFSSRFGECSNIKCDLCDEGCKSDWDNETEECETCPKSVCENCCELRTDYYTHIQYFQCYKCINEEQERDIYDSQNYDKAMAEMDELHGTVEKASLGDRQGGSDIYDTRTEKEKQDDTSND